MPNVSVPMLDLSTQHAPLSQELEDAFKGVVASSHFILGPKVQELERKLAEYLGAKHAIGCASGSDALLLALMALDIGPGDEVITTPFTFFASAGAIARLGAKPVFVDVDPDTFNIDPALVKKAITPKTKAVEPVHLCGLPADMEALRAVCGSRKIPIVEDAAQAIGSEIRGQKTGTFGALAAFSFFPTKNLGGFGDGGLVTTDDDEMAAKVRKLRVHGSHPKYYHSLVGLNSRLDELQAALLLVKFPHLDEWREGRRIVAAHYNALLGGIVKTPAEPAGLMHVYHLYTIRAPRRDELMKLLADRGVSTAIYYPVPLHLQECFKHLGYKKGDLPVSESLCNEVLTLPSYPELTDEQVEYVAQNVAEFYGKKVPAKFIEG